MSARNPELRPPIKVSLVEDAIGTRESLHALLAGTRGLLCTGAHDSAETALRQLPRENPDVLLLDLELPGRSGAELIPLLKTRLPRLEILILTCHGDARRVFPALQAGATGYLLKGDASAADIVEAILLVHAGGAPMSGPIARMVLQRFHEFGRASRALANLSPREEEVLAHVARGAQDKEVADRLGITHRTVTTHLYRIYGKLQVNNRTQAAAKFYRARPEG